MNHEYVAPMALGLILIVLVYAVAAYLRDRRPDAYVGIWRHLGESAPASPFVIAVSAALAFALILVIGDPRAGATALVPSLLVVALFTFVLVLGSVAAFGPRSIAISGPLALALMAAVFWIPDARAAAVGGAMGAIPLVLVLAFIATRRARESG